MAMTKKTNQIHWSMEQNREYRIHALKVNKCTTKEQEYAMEKCNLFSKQCWESWPAACKKKKRDKNISSYHIQK